VNDVSLEANGMAAVATVETPERVSLAPAPDVSRPTGGRGPGPGKGVGSPDGDGRARGWWRPPGASWPARWRQVGDPSARARHFDLVVVVLLMALSLALRWRTLWTSYWGDEAIAIGIAAHPIGSLPSYLVNDGSPPLYYVMLHYWMRLFGRSELATHALSMIPALLAIPASWWSGTKLSGRWAGRGAAALVATCAYLDYYSTEARMYSWLVFAAILALTFFVLAYRGAGRVYWVAAALSMTAILYLQYYGLYLLSATVVVGGGAALRARSWPNWRATMLYGLACAGAFAPWAPQFLYQLRHTGAPWAPQPSVLDFFGDSFNALASAGWAGVLVAIAVAVLAARKGRGARAAPAQLTAPAQPTTPAQLTAPAQPTAPAQLTAPVLPPGRPTTASALALATAIPVVTLVMAWLGGEVVNSWNPRYLGIAVVPALLAVAGGLARAPRRLAVLILAVVTLAATSIPMLVDRAVTVETSKSDVAYLLSELRPRLQPGALVISAEVTDTPVVALDLGKRYRYATPFGLLRDPLLVNWSNLLTRLQGINAASDLARLLAAVPVGGQVLLVNPTSWGGSGTPERYAGAVEDEGIAANQVVLDDPQLQAEEYLPVPQYSAPLYPMTIYLLVKQPADATL
jgi:mannosyltransferase